MADRPEPISSSAGRLENLLGSPYWPLGSSFLKLLNFPPAFRTNFGLGGTSTPLPISANSKDDHPKVPAEVQSTAHEPEVDLDGSPIEDDGTSSHGSEKQADDHQDDDEDDDHTLEELLVKPRLSANRDLATARKPSLSDRLTEPSTWKLRSDRDRSSQEPDHRHYSRLPFSSIPRNTNFHIKGLANLKRSGQHSDSEPLGTSSNLIQCNTQLHPWGSKRPYSTSSDTHSSFPYGKRSRLSEPSGKLNESKKWVRDRYQESDEEFDHRRVSKEINSERYHWSKPHQKSGYYHKQKTQDPYTSHAFDSQHRADNPSDWKKLGIKTGSANLKRPHVSPSFHDEVEDRERRWMQEFKQYDAAPTSHTRSISPFPSSHRRSPSRHLSQSDEDYFTLTQIKPDLKEALHRAVFSWINRSIAEALLRLGLWLEEKKIWSPTEWGSVRVDQLEKVVDMTYERGLAYLLWKCSSVKFKDLLQKPVQSGIFSMYKDPQSRDWYVRFGKDFTPIGLSYRPLIKGYRKHLTDSKSQLPIQAGKFVRQYIMSCPNEEDLLYLFKDDKDPMRCLTRAEQDGIIELTDQPSSRVPFGNRGSLHGNRTWHNNTPVENKYIRLKPFWLSNNHPADQTLLSSPTTTAQTCDTAPNNDYDLSSNSASKNKQNVSNVMENHEGNGQPAIDRRNSDNTSLSAKTCSTSTDTGNEQLDHAPQHRAGEDDSSHRSDQINIIKPTNHRRPYSSNVDELIQSVIDQLAQDTTRRKKY